MSSTVLPPQIAQNIDFGDRHTKNLIQEAFRNWAGDQVKGSAVETAVTQVVDFFYTQPRDDNIVDMQVAYCGK